MIYQSNTILENLERLHLVDGRLRCGILVDDYLYEVVTLEFATTAESLYLIRYIPQSMTFYTFIFKNRHTKQVKYNHRNMRVFKITGQLCLPDVDEYGKLYFLENEVVVIQEVNGEQSYHYNGYKIDFLARRIE